MRKMQLFYVSVEVKSGHWYKVQHHRLEVSVSTMSNSMQRAMALCRRSTYLHYLDGVPLRAITPLRRTLWFTSGEASADSVLESSSNTESPAMYKAFWQLSTDKLLTKIK